mmetsp:Transcript_7225/g.15769  ORF Transcript_7225/g.15769 Transcript_7225/m.15769 type:complete len:261 (+) Transcript_7225:470-1252(+)
MPLAIAFVASSWVHFQTPLDAGPTSEPIFAARSLELQCSHNIISWPLTAYSPPNLSGILTALRSLVALSVISSSIPLVTGRFNITPTVKCSSSDITNIMLLCKSCFDKRKGERSVGEARNSDPSMTASPVARAEALARKSFALPPTLSSSESKFLRDHSFSIKSSKSPEHSSAVSPLPIIFMSNSHTSRPASRGSASALCLASSLSSVWESVAHIYQDFRSNSPISCCGPQPAYPAKTQKSDDFAAFAFTSFLAFSNVVH